MRIALSGIVVGAALAGGAYVSAWLPGPAAAWAPWALAFGSVLAVVSFMALGAAGDGTLRRGLAAVLAFTLLALCGAFAFLLASPDPAPGDPLYLGLPLPAAIMVYGIGLIPFLVIPVAYAITFPADADGPPPGDAGS